MDFPPGIALIATAVGDSLGALRLVDSRPHRTLQEVWPSLAGRN